MPNFLRNFAIFCESFAFTFCETDFFFQRTECGKATQFSRIDFPLGIFLLIEGPKNYACIPFNGFIFAEILIHISH